jgi:choline dehydrogenase-like flavoprotein
MRDYMATAPWGEMVGAELIPGPAVQTDDEILAAFRRLPSSGLHAVGTCRMGSDNRPITPL